MQCVGYGNSGARYRVTDEAGDVLVERTRNPEFDGARALLARGVTGEAEVWRVDGSGPAMIIDIARAAKLTTTEGDTRGPTFVPWQPNQLGEDERALPTAPKQRFPASASGQGRPNSLGGHTRTGSRAQKPLARGLGVLRNRAEKAGSSGAPTT